MTRWLRHLSNLICSTALAWLVDAPIQQAFEQCNTFSRHCGQVNQQLTNAVKPAVTRFLPAPCTPGITVTD